MLGVEFGRDFTHGSIPAYVEIISFSNLSSLLVEIARSPAAQRALPQRPILVNDGANDILVGCTRGSTPAYVAIILFGNSSSLLIEYSTKPVLLNKSHLCIL